MGAKADLIAQLRSTGSATDKHRADILASGGRDRQRQTIAKKAGKTITLKDGTVQRQAPGIVSGRDLVVRSGDSYFSLASRLTGFDPSDPRTAAYAQELARANGGLGVLQAGQSLRAPSAIVGENARPSSRFMNIAQQQTAAFAGSAGIQEQADKQASGKDVGGRNANERIQDKLGTAFAGKAGGGALTTAEIASGGFDFAGRDEQRAKDLVRSKSASAQFTQSGKSFLDSILGVSPSNIGGRDSKFADFAQVGGDDASKSGASPSERGLTPPSARGGSGEEVAAGDRRFRQGNLGVRFGNRAAGYISSEEIKTQSLQAMDALAQGKRPTTMHAFVAIEAGLSTKDMENAGYEQSALGYWVKDGTQGTLSDAINQGLENIYGDTSIDGGFNLGATYQVGGSDDVVIFNDTGTRPRTSSGSIGSQYTGSGGVVSRPPSNSGGFGMAGANSINWRGNFG